MVPIGHKLGKGETVYSGGNRANWIFIGQESGSTPAQGISGCFTLLGLELFPCCRFFPPCSETGTNKASSPSTVSSLLSSGESEIIPFLTRTKGEI